MAAKKSKANQKKSGESLKPGSNPQDAQRVGGQGDFGVHQSDTAGRNYTSQNTKRADPGAAPAHAGENEDRTSGVGGNVGGVGASSGGDIDTDYIGLGGIGAVSQSGSDKTHRAGPDDSDGSSNEFASGAPAEGRNQDRVGRHGAGDPVRGSTVQADDGDNAQGADAANSAEDDLRDSFAGEVSSGEAAGDDNAASDR